MRLYFIHLNHAGTKKVSKRSPFHQLFKLNANGLLVKEAAQSF